MIKSTDKMVPKADENVEKEQKIDEVDKYMNCVEHYNKKIKNAIKK